MSKRCRQLRASSRHRLTAVDVVGAMRLAIAVGQRGTGEKMAWRRPASPGDPTAVTFPWSALPIELRTESAAKIADLRPQLPAKSSESTHVILHRTIFLRRHNFPSPSTPYHRLAIDPSRRSSSHGDHRGQGKLHPRHSFNAPANILMNRSRRLRPKCVHVNPPRASR